MALVGVFPPIHLWRGSRAVERSPSPRGSTDTARVGRGALVGRAAAGQGAALPPEEGGAGSSVRGHGGPGCGSGKGEGCAVGAGEGPASGTGSAVQSSASRLQCPGKRRVPRSWAGRRLPQARSVCWGVPQAGSRAPSLPPSRAVPFWASHGPAPRVLGSWSVCFLGLTPPAGAEVARRVPRRRGQGGSGTWAGSRLGSLRLQVPEAGGQRAQRCPTCGPTASGFSKTRAAVEVFCARPTPDCSLHGILQLLACLWLLERRKGRSGSGENVPPSILPI